MAGEAPGTFSGATPGVPTLTGQSPQEMDSEGATDGLAPISGAQAFSPPVSGAQAFAPQPQSGSQAFSQKPSIADQGEALTPKFMKDPENAPRAAQPNSPVGKAMSVLAIPLRAETAAILKAGSLLGIPGASELKQKLNPEGDWKPNAYLSDISDFYVDKATQGVEAIPGVTGDFLRKSLTASKFVVGMAANVIGDPLVLGAPELMALTKEAKLAQKIGGVVTNAAEVAKGAAPIVDTQALNTVGKERNLFSVGTPLTDARLEIRGQPVQDAVAKLANNAAVNTVAKVVRALSPDTGNAVIDGAGRTHDVLRQGDPVDIMNRYVPQKNALNMTSDENRLASALVESTPNLKPNIRESVTAAVDPSYWGGESGIRSQMLEKITDTAKKIGVELTPGREQAVIDGAFMAKQAGAEDLWNKFHAGVLDESNIAEKTLESHLPHVMDPSYKGVKDAKEYEARLQADEDSVNKTASGTFVSSKDPTRFRTIRTTLEEANQRQKEATGLESFFIEDPVKAQVARLIESKKLLRDSQYMDVVKDYGQKMKASEARQAGMKGIDHPELMGKKISLPGNAGEMGKVVSHKDLYYPPEIADKIQSRLAPEPLTGLSKAMANYNRVFKNIIFASSPGMRMANSLDNVMKTIAVTGKDFMSARKDMLEVNLGKSNGFRSEPTSLRPNGMFYDGEALKSLLTRYVPKGGAFREGMESFLDTGKKMMLQDAGQSPTGLATRLVKSALTFGESGEHAARETLFLQRLRAGWEPEQAAGEVTKWLFDYNRNSPAMKAAQFAMPFIQHPLKTAMIAPELLSTAPGAYNFIQNTFPRVVANAFHDPVTQGELNTILPDSIKQRDGIAGPFINGNTWMAKILGSNQPGALGSMGWFDPRIGLRILNHFSYFDKGGSQRLFSEINPVFQGLIGMFSGEDMGAAKGTPWRELDYANGNTNVANRASYLMGKMIGGVSPFPNAEKMFMQAVGASDPKHWEPYTVLVMKGMAGQFGGVTDLDRDFNSKLLAMHYAYADQKRQFSGVLKQEMKGYTGSAPSFIKSEYGSIRGMAPADLYKQMSSVSQETQEAQLGAQALGGGMSAGDFVARMKGLSDAMAKANTAYQVTASRYLEMASGAKTPEESRIKAGISSYGLFK